MDFFEAQESARRRSGSLVVLFAAAVVAIVVVIYGVAHVAIGPGAGPLDPVLLAYVALGVGATIAMGTAIRTASLRSGGPAVAELMGGRLVAPDSADPEERRLLNVVEEMSIASGTPVPAVYVLDAEEGINAFAAGYSTDDAAVAVTRGALRAWTRDELQGVVAHEFSHILNGDMRLNIRLIGVLYGILLLAVVGRGIVYSGGRRGGRGRDGGGGGAAMLGLALLVVGYIGVFFGKLIKAAVSRQREYLADAAAVEFTRNPDGLAAALKKVGASDEGSRVKDPHAEEVSHLFFANGLGASALAFLSTHPPLEARIRRLDPSWDGEFASSGALAAGAEPRSRSSPAGRSEPPRPEVRVAAAAALVSPAGLVSSVGSPGPEHLAYASRLLDDLPEELRDALHDPHGAVGLVLALVVAAGGEAAGGEVIREQGGSRLEATVLALLPLVRDAGADARLPLLDLALPALRTLPHGEVHRLANAAERLTSSRGRMPLFEYALLHTLRRLSNGAAPADDGRRSVRSFPPLRADVEAVLSALAWAGSDGDGASARASFESGAARLRGDAGPLALRELGAVDLPRVDHALTALRRASRGVQRRFLEACADCAARDGRLHRSEAALLRAVAESLDCPMPPVLPPPSREE